MNGTKILVALAVLTCTAPVRAESSRDMLIEIGFGPFRPDIDSEFGGGATPYKDIMGSGSMLLSKIGYEYEFWNEVGVVSMAATIGYAQDSGSQMLQDGTDAKDTTKFHLLPLSLSAVYRFDYLMQEFGVPFVPHVKAGFDYYVWWITNGAGKVSRASDGSVAKGGTFGGHVSIGMGFLLDFLAPSMAQTFDTDAGVNNTYVFGEYVFSWVDDFGSSSSLDLSSRYFMFGMAFEF